MNDLCKNPIVLCLVAGILAAILSYIDHKVNSEEEFVADFSRYLKILVLVAGLSYGVLTLSCRGCPLVKQTGGGSGSTAPWTEVTASDVSVGAEQIHTGNPNF
jgi:hypothetical protein